MTEHPLEDHLEDYWLHGGLPLTEEAAAPAGPTALERLGRPEVTVRGRNLADVLRPAYDALTDR